MRLESCLVEKVAEDLDYSEAACESTKSRLDFSATMNTASYPIIRE